MFDGTAGLLPTTTYRTDTAVAMVGAAGIEPTTPCSQSRCASAAPRPDDLILYPPRAWAEPESG